MKFKIGEAIMAHTLRGIATVSFFAADHGTAVRWYTEFLGLAPYFERPGYAEFRLGDQETELGIIDAKYVPGTQSAAFRAGVIAYWHVDDVDGMVDAAVSMGATVLEPVQDRGHGFITASVVDPFGNILALMFNPHYLQMLGGGADHALS
jgi:predicted enzyme related to lactoylglutathione lyase